MRKNINSVREIALSDISQYVKKNKIVIIKSGDIWGVSANALDTKETRRLNEELGLDTVNYFGNKNGCKNK